MNNTETDYGHILVLHLDEIFEKTAQTIEAAAKDKETPITVGLTGGSTPKAFYKWAANGNVFSKDLLNRIIWCTSDERFVSLDSDDSNFGNADRLMLQPLNIADPLKLPWKTTSTPQDAADIMNQQFPNNCFDVCLLGMGDDCHTASLFPQSPLINSNTKQNFAAIEVPGKGWRLTITPHGLAQCKSIVITATGPNKAQAIKQVLQDEHNPNNKPAQLLQSVANKTTWLLDSAAASALTTPQS